MSYWLVQGHQSMTFDARRNQTYAEALEKIITPESVVLDLGAGLGIHGLLAAKLGAKRVYLVEPEDIISLTDKIVQANGYSARIQCLQGKIEEINLPEKVDVIISVFTGNFLLEEDLLPSLFYARDKYLKPGGVLIPQAAVMEAVPVSAPELYEKNIACWSEPHMEIDHSPARAFASQSIYYREDLKKARYLAAPASLLTLDFHEANSTHCESEVKYTVTESGLCHGFAGWFKMQLGDTWLSTAPHEPPLHWSAAFLPLDPPIYLEAGEEVTFKLQRPLYGDWTWQVKNNTTQQVRSTFLGAPRSIKTIKKLGLNYQPQINEKGKAALYVLSHCDGSLSVEEL
ncbi:type 12 methyltransferase [Calothrix sp. PCC 7716]|nr:type 12 methyltransferase [Calothrix sp. PCC 7716]